MNSALGGWQLQTIIVLRSGTPYTPVISGDRANTGVGEPDGRISIRPAARRTFIEPLTSWFDKSALYSSLRSTPTARSGQTLCAATCIDSTMRPSSRISRFLGESTLSFRAEFFNISNTTSFNAPNATIDATAGGQVTSTSVPSRDIQFALKYNF